MCLSWEVHFSGDNPWFDFFPGYLHGDELLRLVPQHSVIVMCEVVHSLDLQCPLYLVTSLLLTDFGGCVY